MFGIERGARKTESVISKKLAEVNVLPIDVGDHSDLKKQILMNNIEDQDIKILKILKDELISPNIEFLVSTFYDNIAHSPILLEIINDHSSIERLKKTLIIHLVEMFNGVIDETFIAKRFTVAHTQVRIGLEQKWYMCAYQGLQLEIFKWFIITINMRKM
ncbi:hypothetical protein CR203_18440 [Salipaludibacillus neizhouensis]|uniref:Globin-sensor domain-containing protein n=1 Tax=Salipaludibacillus neizhouensis TaxID=885475 RepID=A0A3A9JZC9_9BACI|nr:protoglobin family protein [Salipaludibacillus neizhouensis]RKL65837.1 hypothetical protein CR203_18440 [Salipaludibacillus neizhouensis]